MRTSSTCPFRMITRMDFHPYPCGPGTCTMLFQSYFCDCDSFPQTPHRQKRRQRHGVSVRSLDDLAHRYRSVFGQVIRYGTRHATWTSRTPASQDCHPTNLTRAQVLNLVDRCVSFEVKRASLVGARMFLICQTNLADVCTHLKPADGTTASSSMAPSLPTAGQQSGLSHPATATVPGRAGSRVQNLLARMQTQVTSRSVQRTVVDLNVRGRVQQVAANHGGVRSSTYLASGSTSPERTATGAGLMSSLPSWLVPSSVDQDSSVRERSRSPASSGSGSARPSLLSVPTTSPAPLPEPMASSPPPRPSLELDMSIVNRPLSVEAQPALPDQDSFRQASSRINAFAPTSAVDASTSTTPRRRMRADHLARCINLQHGMLRESRIGGSDGNDDLLTRRV